MKHEVIFPLSEITASKSSTLESFLGFPGPSFAESF